MENIAAGLFGMFLGLFICINIWIYNQWKKNLK